MNQNLSDAQFTAYRGIIAPGPVPDSDEEILGHLRSKSTALPPSGLLPNGAPARYYEHAFGQHWTMNRAVAERFATTPTAGGYETPSNTARRFSGKEHYGVVIEGQVTPREGRSVMTNNVGTWQGEHELAGGVRNDELHSATAHVVRNTTPRERYLARKEGNSLPLVQHVRSIPIPRDKWR